MNPQKWMRNYKITIQAAENPDGVEDIVIQNPITLDFNVVRNKMAQLNSATFTLYNLSKETYGRIFQDRFTYFNGGKVTSTDLDTQNFYKYRRVILEVGYGGEYIEIFRGNMFQARSERQGTEILTFIDARDGGFDVSTTKTSSTFRGINIRDLLLDLMGKFPNLTAGAVSDDMGELTRPVSINGNTYDAIKMYGEGSVFIDSEKIYVVKPNEVVVPPEFVGPLQPSYVRGIREQSLAPLIAPETGMIGTPRKEESYITVSTILEPRVLMGMFCEVRSDVMPVYNGVYPVVSIQHRGTISGAVSGEAISTFGLFLSQNYYDKLVGIPMIKRVSI